MHPQRSPETAAVTASRPLRFVTAASLFDGHDAAINIMRRLMQDQGAEVIHLGHNRGVQEIVRAALQEDADGIAVSSYQGGHVEYFKYMVDLLREAGAAHVRVFGGGGGVIVPAEIRELETYGVERIYSPHDGRALGLEGMIADMLARTAEHRVETLPTRPTGPTEHLAIARCLTAIENLHGDGQAKSRLSGVWPKPGAARPPVLGITGPGGAGKSSLTDELLLRFTRHFPDLRVAMLAVDPTRRRTGGALLGDRIRLNALADERIFMRSVATRRSHLATSVVLKDEIDFLADCGFGLILVETAGIGQSDTEIVDLVDLPMYVMTSEYGAATQLEKIDMLDYAELIVLNKFEKRGAEDALRDVRKQWKRNRVAFELPDDEVPVFPTIASQFNDPGVNWLFVSLCRRLVDKLGLDAARWTPQLDVTHREPRAQALIPGARGRYLADIAGEGRAIRARLEREADAASLAQSHYESLKSLDDPALPAPLTPYPQPALGGERRPQPADPAPALQRGAGRAQRRIDRPAAPVAGPPRCRHRRALQLRRARPGRDRRQLRRDPVAPAHSQARAAALPRLGRAAAVSGQREPAGRLSLHRRRLSLPARGRGSDPHVRRRGHARAHQPALSLPVAGPAGGAPVDGLRLGHPVRRGPAPAAGHLRQGRQLRRVHLLPGRHEKALFGLRPVQPDHLGVDDHQRPGADDPGHVPERRHRPAGGKTPARERAVAAGAAKNRPTAGRSATAGLRRRAAARQRRPGPGPAGRDRRSAGGCRHLRPHQGRHACEPCAAPCRPTS